MQKVIAVLIFSLGAKFSFSQFNDSVYHLIKYASTGVLNETNERSNYLLNNAFTFNISKKKITFNSNIGWIYGAQQKTITNNDISANVDVDYLKNVQKLYYWGLLSFDKSFSLKINYRGQVGGGVGYHLIKKETANLVLSDGLLYETSDLYDKDLGPDKYQTIRNSFRVKYRFNIKEAVVIDGLHFLQNSLLSIEDYNIRSLTNVTVKLRKWLGITGSLNYNKLSRTNRENLFITYGLTAEKYF
jgi:hypothetical protein